MHRHEPPWSAEVIVTYSLTTNNNITFLEEETCMDCHGLLLTAMDCIGLPWTGIDGVQWTAKGCHGLPWTH